MSSLQEVLPAYVRRKIAEKTKGLQEKYNKSRSIRPTIIEIKNLCLREGKMKLIDIERLTDERQIILQLSGHVNATQEVIDCAILMTVFAKAIGGAETSKLVFNHNHMEIRVDKTHNISGPGIACVLCYDEARTAGAFCPRFGQPEHGKKAYVYLLCGLAHRPPTGNIHDKQLRDAIFARLKQDGLTDEEATIEDRKT